MNITKKQYASIEARAAAAGKTMAEVLDKARVDTSMWQRWKTGKRRPSVKSWNRLQRAVNKLRPLKNV